MSLCYNLKKEKKDIGVRFEWNISLCELWKDS